ncbi:MAG: hypothetical protein QOI74_3098, partial [Micromonosporaceae bacterium]|nr:hypothetical protein [Micromonosporaceae bacterium]
MVSFAQGDLAAAAGVHPWQLLDDLHRGDPSEIEGLAAAFYRAGRHLADARAATQTSQRYVTQGYVVDGGPVLDAATEVARAEHLKGASEHLPAIAKVLTTVASDLADATKKSADEVNILNGKIQGIQSRCLTFEQNIGHHLPPDDREAALQGYQNEAVAAVRHSGGIVKRHVTAYEKTLGDSLKTMADLGYIPPDAVDEGPGDFDPTKADGAKDGQTTIDAINDPDHVASVRLYDTSTQYVDLLNREMKANGRLTDAEYTYLWLYDDTVDSSLP